MVINMKNYFYLFFLIVIFILSCSKKIDFPASDDEMMKPSYLLENSGPWDIIESNNLVIYYNPKLKNDINPIHEEFVTHFNKIINIMELSKEEIDSLLNLNIWIFADEKEQYKKTQHKGIFCYHGYSSAYYTAENTKSAHELGHLLAYQKWGYFSSKNNKFNFLIDEGFAYYVDEGRAFDMDYREKARKILENDAYKIKNILANKQIKELFVNTGRKKAFVNAAFVKFLIETYGVSKFSQLWRDLRTKDDVAFNDVYSKTLDVLEEDFYRYLK